MEGDTELLGTTVCPSVGLGCGCRVLNTIPGGSVGCEIIGASVLNTIPGGFVGIDTTTVGESDWYRVAIEGLERSTIGMSTGCADCFVLADGCCKVPCVVGVADLLLLFVIVGYWESG